MLHCYKTRFAYLPLKDIEPRSRDQLIFWWLDSRFVGILEFVEAGLMKCLLEDYSRPIIILWPFWDLN